jgi:hypothetical protein
LTVKINEKKEATKQPCTKGEKRAHIPTAKSRNQPEARVVLGERMGAMFA